MPFEGRREGCGVFGDGGEWWCHCNSFGKETHTQEKWARKMKKRSESDLGGAQ